MIYHHYPMRLSILCTVFPSFGRPNVARHPVFAVVEDIPAHSVIPITSRARLAMEGNCSFSITRIPGVSVSCTWYSPSFSVLMGPKIRISSLMHGIPRNHLITVTRRSNQTTGGQSAWSTASKLQFSGSCMQYRPPSLLLIMFQLLFFGWILCLVVILCRGGIFVLVDYLYQQDSLFLQDYVNRASFGLYRFIIDQWKQLITLIC